MPIDSFTPPEKIIFPIDEEFIAQAFTENKPENFINFFKSFMQIFQQAYTDLRDGIVSQPEYQKASAQPTPAEGSFSIWEDDVNNKTYICYNNAGVIKKVELT